MLTLLMDEFQLIFVKVKVTLPNNRPCDCHLSIRIGIIQRSIFLFINMQVFQTVSTHEFTNNIQILLSFGISKSTKL